MSAKKGYGDECPFCKTVVPRDATVCTGCNATKGHRFDAMGPGEQWARFFVWCSSVGLALCVTLMAWSQWWRDRAVVPFCLGLAATILAYGVHRLFRWMFGTVVDPLWVRRQ